MATVATTAALFVRLWLIEGQRPDAWDLIGASVSVAGMGLILFGPRQ